MRMRIKPVIGAGAAAAALFTLGGAQAQYATPMAGAPTAYSPAQSGGPARQTVPITKGRSAQIDFDFDVRIAGSTDPEVADVRMVTPRRAVIMGVDYGQTDAQFYDTQGRHVMSLDVRVEADISELNGVLQRIVPEANITTQSVGDNIILAGTAPNAAAADRAVQMAAIFAGDPERVRNFLAITNNDQVTLQVQVVEVNRTVIKQLGFNTDFVFGQLGVDQYVFGNSPGYAINGGYQGGFSGGFQRDTTQQPVIQREVQVPVEVFDPATGTTYIQNQLRTYDFIDRNDLLATPQASAGSGGTNQATGLLQAFERQGLVRTLAEPNLTAISGEPANFLVGGRYPVPAGRDPSGNISVEFQPFGVGLGFTPVVLSEGRISLQISAEVSELSPQGALTLAGIAGAGTSTIIPALSVRNVNTTVELPSGGSMMIAGLLQESTRQNLDKIPGISDVPILGALARSRDYLNNETELVIIVSAYLTSHTTRDQLQTPADGLRIASDLETVLLGRLNTAYDAPESATEGRTYEGPFGHVID